MNSKQTQKNPPEGWIEKKLSEVATLTSSKRVYLSDYVDSGIPFYRGKEISLLKNNKIVDDILFISKDRYEEFKLKYGAPIKDDILVTAVGTLGNIYRVPDNEPFYFKDGNLIWLKNIQVSSVFLEYLLTYETRKLVNTAIGSSQKALTIVALNKVKLSIPVLSEQERIVKVLETWDEGINKLGEVIALKREVKKGLMQKLLTGDLRLPGFKGEWKNLNLKQITSLLKDGSHGTHKDVEGGVALLSAKDVRGGAVNVPDDARKISREDFEKIHKNYSLKNDDILICLVGSIGRVARVKNYDDNYTLQRSVGILRFEKCSSEFMYQFLQSPYFQNELSKKENKGAQGGVYLGELGKIKVTLPEIDEQIEIANILGTLDAEINLLYRKKKKLLDQKKYLLNNLVTGQIRTPENL